MKKALVLYMPVVHQGYIELINRNLDADIFLLSKESIKDIDSETADKWSRDIRAIPATIVKRVVEGYGVNCFYFIKIDDLQSYDLIIMPNEDISLKIKELLLDEIQVQYDNAFLRWDWSKSTAIKEVVGKYPVVSGQLNRFIMSMAERQSFKSSDVWRQVGAVIPMENRRLLCAGYNQHMPSPMTPYIEGDVRLDMKPGERPEIGTPIHAEADVITQAAREGISLQGKSIYVTTFPCSNCARLIARSGIKAVYFKDGYSQLDAAEIFSAYDIEVFQVQ